MGRRFSLRSGSALKVGKWGRQSEDFPTFRASTNCREIGKVERRFSLRSEPALNVGNRESKAKTFLTFRFSTNIDFKYVC